ncbi:hypothetical protein MXB_2484 [Myxobolus squamalis]|nr:hypothetical protein MXB_2484 [Myxobolus squamalis]
MCFVELIIGHATHSMSLVADSFHMLFDIISLFIGLFSFKLSQKNSVSVTYPYGWSRVSLVGAFINSSFLLSVCLIIWRESLERIIHLKKVENSKIVLFTAIIGLGVNITGFFVFHSSEKENLVKFLSKLMKKNVKKDRLQNIKDEDKFLLDTNSCNKIFFKSGFKNLHSRDKSNSNLNLNGIFLHIIMNALGSISVIVKTIF